MLAKVALLKCKLDQVTLGLSVLQGLPSQQSKCQMLATAPWGPGPLPSSPTSSPLAPPLNETPVSPARWSLNKRPPQLRATAVAMPSALMLCPTPLGFYISPLSVPTHSEALADIWTLYLPSCFIFLSVTCDKCDTLPCPARKKPSRTDFPLAHCIST